MSKIKLMLPLVWSMPNKWTFQMPVVKELIEKIDGLVIEHGGNRNNTLVIIERKL